jgi:hypothetical protein
MLCTHPAWRRFSLCSAHLWMSSSDMFGLLTAGYRDPSIARLLNFCRLRLSRTVSRFSQEFFNRIDTVCDTGGGFNPLSIQPALVGAWKDWRKRFACRIGIALLKFRVARHSGSNPAIIQFAR